MHAETRLSIIDERSNTGISLVVDGGIAFRVNFCIFNKNILTDLNNGCALYYYETLLHSRFKTH